MTDQRQKAERHQRSRSYLEQRRRLLWEENTLASADESETRRFDWRSIRLFGVYLARYKGLTMLSVLLMLLYTATNLANPSLIEVAIDQITTHDDLGGLALICLILLLVNIVMWQAQYWQIWTMSWAGQQVLYLLSSDMFRHLQQLSLSFYDRTQIG